MSAVLRRYLKTSHDSRSYDDEGKTKYGIYDIDLEKFIIEGMDSPVQIASYKKDPVESIYFGFEKGGFVRFNKEGKRLQLSIVASSCQNNIKSRFITCDM